MSALIIVSAKNVIFIENLVFGMLGPFNMLKSEYMASLLFSSLINLPIYSECAINASKSLKTFSRVSSSLQVRYSRMAFKPFC